MQLNVSELLKKKIDKLPFDLTFELDHLDREEYRVNLKAPITIKGTAEIKGNNILVKGILSIFCDVQCSRCLEIFEDSFIVDFEESFSKSHEDEEEEDHYPIIEGELIFDDMVMDNLILSAIAYIC